MLYWIYKICCDDCDYVYVGSTKAFSKRKYDHKYNCYNDQGKKYNRKVYQTIRKNGGWNNWRMVCIDEIDVDTKQQAEIKEEEYRVKLNAKLNMVRAYTTEEQKKACKANKDRKYRQAHKDEIKERAQKYYEKNKEKIKEKYNKNKRT